MSETGWSLRPSFMLHHKPYLIFLLAWKLQVSGASGYGFRDWKWQCLWIRLFYTLALAVFPKGQSHGASIVFFASHKSSFLGLSLIFAYLS
jgi:hypothetical protein